CKRALEEADGDIDRAQQLLREKGIAAAGKRADRDTTEGQVVARTASDRMTLVSVGCETEPVSSNDEFREFAASVADAVDSNGIAAAEELDAARVALAARLGENIVIVGVERYEAGAGETLASYVHPPANKIGVMVKLEGGNEEIARQLAMHVSFANPSYLTRDEVPQDAIDAERAVLEKLDEVASKPADIQPKIIEGMLNKRFFADSVLTDQAWIHDDSLTVGKALGDARVVAFVRYALG
ncbi:MAG: translation elongation factor Ts, partial [Gaiellaceae bacterium]